MTLDIEIVFSLDIGDKNMKKMKLSNGVLIPVNGLGTWQTPNEIAAKVVKDGLDVGYRHIDTAIAYGNEVGVGEGIRLSNVKREDVFITSKVPAEVKNYEEAKRSINESLLRLKLDYVDLMLIHAPRPWAEMGANFTKNYNEENARVWKALEEAYEAGQCRSIGVSNFSIDDLKYLFKHCKIKPMVNQILLHVGVVDCELVKFCKDNDILVEAYSPIGTGRLLNNEALLKMAKKYDVSVAQLCIRYALNLQTVVLPKTTHKEFMVQNFNVEFNISDEDMERLNKFNL